jgi:hypothetical protein
MYLLKALVQTASMQQRLDKVGLKVSSFHGEMFKKYDGKRSLGYT